MLSYEAIFERLQWGYKFNLKEGDSHFTLKNESFLSASCFGKNGYVFIRLYQNKVHPWLSSVHVTIYDRRSSIQSRQIAYEDNYHKIKRQINAFLG